MRNRHRWRPRGSLDLGLLCLARLTACDGSAPLRDDDQLWFKIDAAIDGDGWADVVGMGMVSTAHPSWRVQVFGYRETGAVSFAALSVCAGEPKP
jgi:hypothetical protein